MAVGPQGSLSELQAFWLPVKEPAGSCRGANVDAVGSAVSLSCSTQGGEGSSGDVSEDELVRQLLAGATLQSGMTPDSQRPQTVGCERPSASEPGGSSSSIGEASSDEEGETMRRFTYFDPDFDNLVLTGRQPVSGPNTGAGCAAESPMINLHCPGLLAHLLQCDCSRPLEPSSEAPDHEIGRAMQQLPICSDDEDVLVRLLTYQNFLVYTFQPGMLLRFFCKSLKTFKSVNLARWKGGPSHLHKQQH